MARMDAVGIKRAVFAGYDWGGRAACVAAAPGPLVLSTLHTVDAGQSINRILGLFSLGEEQQLRLRLADTLRYFVSQRLAPKVDGGRQLLVGPQSGEHISWSC